MSIDQTMRPETEEGEDLIVEELFVEDYGPISAEPAEELTGVKKQAERVKRLAMRARKRPIFGLFAIAGLVLASVVLARVRGRRARVVRRLVHPFRFAR